MIDPDRLDFYNNLIADCGADTNVTNRKDGLTAFGKFRETQRSAQDFELTFNLGGSAFGSSSSSNNNGSKTIATTLERMLMPTNGLSEADQTLKEEFDNTDTDDEDDDDEFDMDDDELDDDDENV